MTAFGRGGAYPKTRDSGHAWLGEIPGDWECLPHRALFDEVKVQGHPDEQLLSVTIARGVIPQAELLASTSKKDSSNLDRSKYKLVEPGDLVYNKMRAWQGALGAARDRGIVSPAYVVQRLRDSGLPRYFHYLLRTKAFAREAQRWSYGITSDQWSLRPEHFKLIYSCVPPTDEQRLIVRYLDNLEERVGRLASAKRRVVDLLREQELALITRTVTSGVASAPMRVCELPWVNAVPETWDVVPLKRHWKVTDCKHATVPFVDDGVPLASVREVQQFDLDLTTANRTNMDHYQALIQGGRELRRGDIVYCRNVSVGAAAYIVDDTTVAMGQDVCRIRTATENNRYLNYLLHSSFMRAQLSTLQIGSTFSRINVADVRNLAVLRPPREEQDRIVEYLDQAVRDFREPRLKTIREIQLLHEFRDTVTEQVVTGRMDIRDIATTLGDIAEEDVAGISLGADDGVDGLDDVDSEFDEVPA